MKKFTPIVDIVEGAVKRLHTKNGNKDVQLTGTESKFQYQRAYDLSRDLREQLARYSVDQFKQIESQNVLVYAKPLFICICHCIHVIYPQQSGFGHRSQNYRDRFLLLLNRPV